MMEALHNLFFMNSSTASRRASYSEISLYTAADILKYNLSPGTDTSFWVIMNKKIYSYLVYSEIYNVFNTWTVMP